MSSLSSSAWLDGDGEHVDVAFVTTGYDTAFAPLTQQLSDRVTQLETLMAPTPRARWTLRVVDDLSAGPAFGGRARAAIAELRARGEAGDRVLFMSAPPGARAPCIKGRSLLHGMADVLAGPREPSAIVYVNLNLKVDIAHAGQGLRRVVTEGADAAVGSRAAADGGEAIGRGRRGEFKSRAYNRLVRWAMPRLAAYRDTNAPMKVLAPRAARLLVDQGRIDGVTMDAEWLDLLEARGFRVVRYPVVWRQISGSHPPWGSVVPSLVDVLAMRRRAKVLTESVPW